MWIFPLVVSYSCSKIFKFGAFQISGSQIRAALPVILCNIASPERILRNTFKCLIIM